MSCKFCGGPDVCQCWQDGFMEADWELRRQARRAAFWMGVTDVLVVAAVSLVTSLLVVGASRMMGWLPS